MSKFKHIPKFKNTTDEQDFLAAARFRRLY